MKHPYIKYLACLLLTALVSASLLDNAMSQGSIILDDELLANSRSLELGAKGGFLPGPITRYEIGRYHIVRGKNRWTDEALETKLFGGVTNTKAWNMHSFIFERDDKKTIIVNRAIINSLLSRDWVRAPYFALEFGDGISFVGGIATHKITVIKVSALTSFTINPDSAEWIMVMEDEIIDEDISDNSSRSSFLRVNIPHNIKKTVDEYALDFSSRDGQMAGRLTNGNYEIVIETRTEIEITKSGRPKLATGMYMGYEFFLEDKSVAAVQVYPFNLNKIFARMRNDLDDELEMAIATAIATILVDMY